MEMRLGHLVAYPTPPYSIVVVFPLFIVLGSLHRQSFSLLFLLIHLFKPRVLGRRVVLVQVQAFIIHMPYSRTVAPIDRGQ